MATATHNEVTEAHSQAIARRRELASKVKDLETAWANQQNVVASVGAILLSARTNHGPTRAEKQRAKLAEVANALFWAEQALAAFDEENPGAKLMDLFEREK